MNFVEIPMAKGGVAFVPADAFLSTKTHAFYGSHVYISVSPGWIVSTLSPAEVVRRFKDAQDKQ